MLVSRRADRPARPSPRETVGQPARVAVIVGQPLDVMLERVEAGGGEDAGLAHAAAEHLADAVHAVDELRRAADQRADRRAEALRQAERDGVEPLHPARRRDAAGDDGVEQPRAVEVQTQAALACRRRRSPRTCSNGKMRPPEALWVFSSATAVTGA